MKLPSTIWKKGPAAFNLAKRSGELMPRLSERKKRFLSQREVIRIFGIGQATLIDWLEKGYLRKDGPDGKFSVEQLLDFLGSLRRDAKSPPSPQLRFGKEKLENFKKLRKSRFLWSLKERFLTPVQIAKRIGCDAALIRRAIYFGVLEGKRKTPARWVVGRGYWMGAFPRTVVKRLKK